MRLVFWILLIVWWYSLSVFSKCLEFTSEFKKRKGRSIKKRWKCCYLNEITEMENKFFHFNFSNFFLEEFSRFQKMERLEYKPTEKRDHSFLETLAHQPQSGRNYKRDIWCRASHTVRSQGASWPNEIWLVPESIRCKFRSEEKSSFLPY